MSSSCGRSGCQGRIEDGFCTDCGLAPAGAPRTAGSSAEAGRPGSNAGPTRSVDPLARILADPKVPDSRRVCSSCRSQVTLETGFCARCGKSYSFEPKLRAGDVVGRQYEVRGPIAFGGLGWIYLAQDRELDKRWVVLKGLLDSRDAASSEAALHERSFLASVKHPNVVSVYNFVTHGDEGFIVMELVGGRTLSELRKAHGPLPVDEAVEHILGVLPALEHLHAAGLVYCDLKPSNVMVEGAPKLIDLGGVRRLSEKGGCVYGTEGFYAPEIGEGRAPTVESDLYTVARTLATLVCDFDFLGANRYRVPSVKEEPVFARHESLGRFLAKATREAPERRFRSAAEMAEQLQGVLRDIRAAREPAEPARSRAFRPEPASDDLPDLTFETADLAAAAIRSALEAEQARRADLLLDVGRRFPDASGARFGASEALIATRAFAAVEKLLESPAPDQDWRTSWYLGRAYLALERPAEALARFEHVFDELPGEVAPRLACALACERAGDRERAAALHERVSRSDPRLVAACFGLARCCDAASDPAGALEALRRIPPSSASHARARAEVAGRLLRAATSERDLLPIAATIEALAEDSPLVPELRARFFERAVAVVEATRRRPAAPLPSVLGVPLRATELRAAAERELRACARRAGSPRERAALVEAANRIRPFTLI